jgi:uncharacterized protein YkwD
LFLGAINPSDNALTHTHRTSLLEKRHINLLASNLRKKTMRVVSQERFITEALQAHNECRQLHGAEQLKEDLRLSGLAKEWAESLAERDVLEYRSFTYKGAEVGQNIMRLDLSELGLYYFAGRYLES